MKYTSLETPEDRKIRILNIDTAGSPIAGVRVNPAQAYSDIPGLLKSYINESSIAAWNKIKERTEYIYLNLPQPLSSPLRSARGLLSWTA